MKVVARGRCLCRSLASDKINWIERSTSAIDGVLHPAFGTLRIECEAGGIIFRGINENTQSVLDPRVCPGRLKVSSHKGSRWGCSANPALDAASTGGNRMLKLPEKLDSFAKISALRPQDEGARP